ncbi:hypothetical protein SCUP515_13182 [Seiridium cupressi]
MCNQFRPTTLQNQSRAPGDLDPFRTRRELLVRIFQPGGLSGFFLAGHSYLKPEDIRHINLQIDMIDHVLKVIGDTQLLNGISLLIGAFAQHETLEFYHFHMVYDTVNFTGYMLYALRASNEAYLSGGSENEWGFGPVVALTLVASTCLECVRGTIRYNILKNERDDSKEGIFWKRFLRFLQIPEPDADEEAGRVADDGSSTVVSRRRSLPEGFKYT